jgi:hypothetical protein
LFNRLNKNRLTTYQLLQAATPTIFIKTAVTASQPFTCNSGLTGVFKNGAVTETITANAEANAFSDPTGHNIDFYTIATSAFGT